MNAEVGTKTRWYITTDFFANGGEFIASLGSWNTREEALAARFGYELGRRREGLYFVDCWPAQEEAGQR